MIVAAAGWEHSFAGSSAGQCLNATDSVSVRSALGHGDCCLLVAAESCLRSLLRVCGEMGLSRKNREMLTANDRSSLANQPMLTKLHGNAGLAHAIACNQQRQIAQAPPQRPHPRQTVAFATQMPAQPPQPQHRLTYRRHR